MADYISQIKLPNNTTYDLKDAAALPKAGGIMTGNIRRYYNSASAEPMITMLSNNQDIYLWEAGHGSSAATTTTSNHYKLLYKGTGSDSTDSNYLQLIAHKTSDLIAVQIDEAGNVTLPQMNKGSTTKPIYLNNGTITEGTELGASAYHADSYFIKAITSTDNAVVRFDETAGQVQNSGVIIDDSNNVTTTGHFILEKANNVTWASGGQASEPAFEMKGATKTFKFKFSTSGENVDVGWDWAAGDGSGAFFRSTNATSNAGMFGFFARKTLSNGTKTSSELWGYASDTNNGGKLIWAGKRVVTATDGSQIGSATQPVYISTAGVATAISYTIEKSVPNDAKFSDTTYSAGTGLSLSSTTFNHSNSITAKTKYGSTSTSASANGGTIIVTDIKYDAQGHITASTDRTITLSQTTYNFTGVNFTSGNGDTGTQAADSITSNGHWSYTSEGPTSQLGAQSTTGALYTQAYSANWVGQIAQDYRDGQLFVRGKNNKVWQDWMAIPMFTTTTGGVGGTNTPIYIDTNGKIVAGTTLGTASTHAHGDYATSGHTHGWADLTNNADSLSEGSSNWTDNTEILTSYASDNGFADTNAKGKVYRRDAIKAYNYIKGKLDSVYATQTTVKGLLAAADAMIFKGTLGTGGTITAVPDGTSGKEYQAGYTYKIIEAGTYANIVCEIGDLLIAISDSTNGQTEVNNAHWTVAQTNIDGAVTGPASVTAAGNIAIFDGKTGKIIKDSGTTIANATVAAAGKATNDSDGNKISTTYLKLSSSSSQTVSGPVIFSKTTDVVLTGTDATQPAVIIGGAYNAQHLELDGNEIQSKSNKTTANALYINNLGGAVEIGNNSGNYLNVAYNSEASSTITGALRVAGGAGIAKKLYVGGLTTINNTTPASSAKGSSQLQIWDSSTSTPAAAIELRRGATGTTNGKASWQIINDRALRFAVDYSDNAASQAETYNHTILTLDYNTPIGISVNGGGVFTTNVKAKTFTISSTDKEAHIAFSRSNWNYITMPNNSAAAISFGAGDVGDNENQKLIIFQSGLVRPNSNNKQDLGDTTHAWKTIYTNILSGTSDVQIKTNTASTTITTATFSGSYLLPGTGAAVLARYFGSSTYPWDTIYGKSINLYPDANAGSDDAQGFRVMDGTQKYSNLSINTKGTTSVVGIASFALGNTIKQGNNKNAKGIIWLYGTAARGTQIETAYTGDSSHSTMYFPNHAGPGYLVHTEGTTKVGDTNAPVYIAANGRVTACTTYANATVAKAGAANLTTTTNAIAYYSDATGTFASGTNVKYLNSVGVKRSGSDTVIAYQDGLQINCTSYGNAANNLANTNGSVQYGDGGGQIQFITSQPGAMIYSHHDNTSGMGAAFHFVSNTGSTAVKASGLIATTRAVIGEASVDGDYTLKVNGNSYFSETITMAGQIKTSFQSSIAIGSYASNQSTIANLINEVRYSSGCMGSVSITTAYTLNNVTIPTGWYNFEYVPHRSGGVNGQASGDNCNYGVLYLHRMNGGEYQDYTISFDSAAIKKVYLTSGFKSSITSGEVIVSDGTLGAIKTSGYTIAASVPSNAVFTDHYAWTDITGKPSTFAPTIGTGATDAMAGNTNVNNVTQGTTTTSNWRKVILAGGDSQAAATTAVVEKTNQVYQAVGVAVQPSTGTLYATNMSAGTRITSGVYNFTPLVGTGTAAVDKGSGVSPRYIPAIWTFNSGRTATNGDIVTIKIPVAGHDWGTYMSIDNGANYYPLVYNTSSRITTHFGVNTIITVMFDSGGSASSMYARAGQDNTTRITVSGGVWRVLTFYDSGNSDNGHWYLRYYTIKAQTAVTNVHLIGGTDNGYNNIDSGTAFDIRYPVLYCGTALGAGKTGNNNFIFHYAVNVKNSSGTNISGWTQYKSVYIKGTVSGNTFTPISGGNPYVQTITESDDGYVYYYIGHVYDANGTAITFNATGARMFWYKNGAIRPYTDTYAAKNNSAVVSVTCGTDATLATINGSAIKINVTKPSYNWSDIDSKPITFLSTTYGTTGWKQLGGKASSQSSIVVFKPTDSAAVTWGTISHSAVIAWGNGDTKGMIDCSYNSPLVSIAGGNAGGSTDAAPKWYFKLSATSGKTYTLPTDSKTLCAADGSNASGTNWGISITGSSASCTGNAATASKIAAKLAATTKTFLLGTSTTITGTAANVDLIGDTGVYLTTTAGQLSAKSYYINDGTNEKVRMEWNPTDLSLDFIFA